LIDSHSFGYVSGSSPEKATLEGSFYAPATGLYTLDIRNYRNAVSTSNLVNFIDTVTLTPNDWMLGADGCTFSCLYGSTRNFELRAGPAHAGRTYWMWAGLSGTYPGLKVNGVEIPLNHDLLVQFSWLNPGALGTGFVGVLDGNGNATASMKIKPSFSYYGITLYYTYVVLSAGGAMPPLAASNQIHACIVYVE
jgi:hypothetical protein